MISDICMLLHSSGYVYLTHFAARVMMLCCECTGIRSKDLLQTTRIESRPSRLKTRGLSRPQVQIPTCLQLVDLSAEAPIVDICRSPLDQNSSPDASSDVARYAAAFVTPLAESAMYP